MKVNESEDAKRGVICSHMYRGVPPGMEGQEWILQKGAERAVNENAECFHQNRLQ